LGRVPVVGTEADGNRPVDAAVARDPNDVEGRSVKVDGLRDGSNGQQGSQCRQVKQCWYEFIFRL